MTPIDYNILSKAMPCLLGYGYTPYPQQGKGRLGSVFGVELAEQIEPTLDQILTKINDRWLDWNARKPDNSCTMAKEEARSMYPELSEEALVAIEWAFTWWNR
jgi:hypothetical protein